MLGLDLLKLAEQVPEDGKGVDKSPFWMAELL